MTFKTRVFLTISEKELLRMVREVSEDRIYDTIEFNEFLQMMSKQMRNYTQDSLRDAFRYILDLLMMIYEFFIQKSALLPPPLDGNSGSLRSVTAAGTVAYRLNFNYLSYS